MRMLMPAGGAQAAADPRELLLVRAARGDTRAFADLVQLLARPALGLALKVLGDRALAEDAVQEALARLWREAPRYDATRGSFAAWWRRMLLNCALDGRRRLRPAAALDEASQIRDPAPGPAGDAEIAHLVARVQAAAATLPARQRAALLLFHGEGLSMAEIADALQTSPKAVDGLLLRARADLKLKLADLKDELE